MYVKVSKAADFFDLSPDYFKKNRDKFIINKHYFKKGNVVRWNIIELEKFFKTKHDESDVNIDDIIERLV